VKELDDDLRSQLNSLSPTKASYEDDEDSSDPMSYFAKLASDD
jgi:hypothetical protein